MRLSGVSVLILVGCASAVSASHSFFEKPSKTGVTLVTVEDSYESYEIQKKKKKRCKNRNEVWYECLPSCPITCDSISRRCRSTKKYCEEGCDCAKGYARLYRGGRCESTRKCPDQGSDVCKDRNEEYTTCGRSCDEKCDASKEICITQCVPGCFCRKGYVRINGKCVKRDECRDQCNPWSEVFQTCGNPCHDSCNTTSCNNSFSRPCVQGCFCRDGFKRASGELGSCVPASQCNTTTPTQCVENQTMRCGLPCEDTCDKANCNVTLANCQIGCFCSEGFARDARGNCKRRADVCPCTENEVASTGKACRELCVPPTNCSTEADVSKCFCKVGFKRNTTTGLCQLEADACSTTGPIEIPPCTGANEIHATCGRACEDNCRIEASCANVACVPNLCVCASGFKRINGVCVATANCQCGANESVQASNSCLEVCPLPNVICGTRTETSCFCNAGTVRIGGTCQVFNCAQDIEV